MSVALRSRSVREFSSLVGILLCIDRIADQLSRYSPDGISKSVVASKASLEVDPIP